MKKITFLLCMLSLIFAGSLIGCSDAQYNPSTDQIPNAVAGAKGPQSVDLGTSGNYVILSKTGISTVPSSIITGDIGTSPMDRTGLTQFSETIDDTNVFSKSAQVTGKLYAADYADPTPSNLTTAVSNMETAYTDAAGRKGPDKINLGAGEIGGLTLAPGLYKWGTDVSISSEVTLNGGLDDVWIFQVAGRITVASAKTVTLTGGALPENIFWQTSGGVTLGSNSQFKGIVLSKSDITLNSGASINGRLLAQTAVTLQSSIVTEP